MFLTILWWFLCSTLIGWLFFPLTSKIFPNLPGKGYAFSRSIGLLIWGYFFWLFVSLGVFENNLISEMIILILLIGFSLYFGYRQGFSHIWQWIKSHWSLILGVELVFTIAFLAFVVFRGTSPAIVGTEKPMELTFLNAALRSRTFPPYDPWLSGYQVSYYYFGYVLVAILARLTGTDSAVAFNLSQALWFGMVASSAYGLLVDFLAFWDQKKPGLEKKIKGWMLRWALLAPILILLLGNAYGFFDVLNARGLFWHQPGEGASESRFWAWMDLRGLSEPPNEPYHWQPQKSGTVPWWDASRVIQDRTFDGEDIEIIDEFPAFSFVLGDLHPHLLAMPFVLLAVGLAFEKFTSPKENPWQFWRIKLPINPGRFILVSGLIGSLSFINTWDWPIYVGLYAAVLTIDQVEGSGWRFRRLWQFITFGIAMGIIGFVFFLPFFIHFSSQAAGFLPSIIFFTRGNYFWVMFGILLIPIYGYLVWRSIKTSSPQQNKTALWVSLGILGILLTLNVFISLIAVRLKNLGELFLANLGASGFSVWQLLWGTLKRRISQPGTTLTLLGLLILSLTIFFPPSLNPKNRSRPIHRFIVLLILWGVLLTFVPEFIYLLDNFGTRMNTIFKFYYQAWILWSLAAAFIAVLIFRKDSHKKGKIDKILLYSAVVLTGAVVFCTVLIPSSAGFQEQSVEIGNGILDWLWICWAAYLALTIACLLIRRGWMTLIRIVLIYLFGIGLFYPLQAIQSRTSDLEDLSHWTLDGSDYYRNRDPALIQAVNLLRNEQLGVLAEAVGPDGGDYDNYGRVSMLSGMPSVLGWLYHEVQWRGGEDEIGSRPADIALLYETTDWETAQVLIDKYNIEYIYIGDLERETYQIQEDKFTQHMSLFFGQGDVKIYYRNID